MNASCSSKVAKFAKAENENFQRSYCRPITTKSLIKNNFRNQSQTWIVKTDKKSSNHQDEDISLSFKIYKIVSRPSSIPSTSNRIPRSFQFRFYIHDQLSLLQISFIFSITTVFFFFLFTHPGSSSSRSLTISHTTYPKRSLPSTNKSINQLKRTDSDRNIIQMVDRTQSYTNIPNCFIYCPSTTTKRPRNFYRRATFDVTSLEAPRY